MSSNVKQELQSVLEKVIKLRALAARASTQAEAEAAAAQADAIIAKYRLDEADLLSHEGRIDDEDVERHVDPLDRGKGVNGRWAGILANNLAKHYGCYVYRDSTRVSFPVYGRASDVAILRLMYAWAKTEILRLSEREHGRAAKNGFRLGAVVGLLAALRESTKKEVEKHSGAAGLVLLSRAKQSEALAREGVPGGLRQGRGGSTSDPGAYNRGRAAGDSMGRSGRALGTGGGKLLPAKGGGQ